MSGRLPSFGEASRAALSLTLLRMRRGRAVWFAAAVGGLVVLMTLAIRLGGGVAPRVLWDAVVAWPLRYVVGVLVPFLFCATALSEEVEARTITYLFSRPAPRSALLVGKYAAGTAIGGLVVCASVLCVFLVAFSAGGGDDPVPWGELGRALGGFALSTACYGAMFLFFGVLLVDAPYLLCLLYVGLVEIPLSLLPSVVRVVSMSFHLTNVLGKAPHEQNPVLATWNPDVPVVASACVLGVMALLFLAGALSMASGSEYRFGKA
ncbi:MAG: ABC transporter permease [Deltaproteobacteria bacterium]|nr:ABC transporter permease [Deltaproteobacteria bacterium]